MSFISITIYCSFYNNVMFLQDLFKSNQNSDFLSISVSYSNFLFKYVIVSNKYAFSPVRYIFESKVQQNPI